MHKIPSKKPILYFVFFLTIFLFSACQKPAPKATATTKNTFALDTVISVTYYDEKDADAVDKALELCCSYEQIFSRTDENSELYKLNAAINHASESDIIRVAEDGTSYYGFPVSAELYNILSECAKYSDIVMDGKRAFNYSLGSISAIYNFSGEEHQIPTTRQLEELLPHTDTTCFHLEDGMFVTTDTQITLDLGAIAKGYISDVMKAQMKENGVISAIINLGGNVLLIGSKPDGSDFEIGIANPKNPNDFLTSVKVSDRAVVTSGIYQRYFEKDGVFYHHILDPETGLPTNNGLSSVSIISKSGCEADALSTTLFVYGAEKKEELQKLFPSDQFICVDSNMKIN